MYTAGQLTADSTEQYETLGVSRLSSASCFNFLTKTPASGTVKELPVILYRTLHLGASFLEGGLSAGKE